MTKREAYLIGRETGNSIAEHNFHDFINQTDEVIDFISTNHYQDDEPVYQFQCLVSQIESEHYRQFYHFQFTAQDFNESHDPDGMWSEYEKGVWNGSKQTFHKLNKDRMKHPNFKQTMDLYVHVLKNPNADRETIFEIFDSLKEVGDFLDFLSKEDKSWFRNKLHQHNQIYKK